MTTPLRPAPGGPCVQAPVDIWLAAPTMAVTKWWLGERSWAQLLRHPDVHMHGDLALQRQMHHPLTRRPFALLIVANPLPHRLRMQAQMLGHPRDPPAPARAPAHAPSPPQVPSAQPGTCSSSPCRRSFPDLTASKITGAVQPDPAGFACEPLRCGVRARRAAVLRCGSKHWSSRATRGHSRAKDRNCLWISWQPTAVDQPTRVASFVAPNAGDWGGCGLACGSGGNNSAGRGH